MGGTITLAGPGPVVTYQHRGSQLHATEWTELRFADYGGYVTIYNQDTTNDLLIAFPATVGTVSGISGTGATDSRGVVIPAGGWREFGLGGGEGPCGPIASAPSCSVWGGTGASHPFDAVQSVGSSTAGNS